MKKVLIITYYWPPAGGPGVQRWLKFVKYLRDFQIEPVVYIPDNADYPLLDESLEAQVPSDITILKQKIFEPYFLARIFSRKQTTTISSGIISEEKNQNFLQKLLLYIRGNFFIPDARVFWVKPSVTYLEKCIKHYKIDTIITTGPPHSVHLIGLKLKELLPVKWIADFRDPWTQIGYHKMLKLSESSEAKHRHLEQEVLKNASHILTTSFTTKADFEKTTTVPVTIITNGHDNILLEEVPLDEKFTISHIGSLLSERNPENLWKVLKELVIEDASFARNFQLKLVGAVSDKVIQSIQAIGLKEHLELSSYVVHTEALKLQRSSQVLLLVEIDSEETRGIIPGKLFEYIAANRPILAVGPRQWDVARILQETGAGNHFTYADHEALKERVYAYFQLYQQDALRSHSRNIDKYSRRNLTGKLASVIFKQ